MILLKVKNNQDKDNKHTQQTGEYMKNEQAHPMVESNGPDDRNYHAGLTKLEHFAGLAMQGLLASPLTQDEGGGVPPAISRASIMHAKELIKHLEQETK